VDATPIYEIAASAASFVEIEEAETSNRIDRGNTAQSETD
jgi:hypothetical protein